MKDLELVGKGLMMVTLSIVGACIGAVMGAIMLPIHILDGKASEAEPIEDIINEAIDGQDKI